MLRETLIELMEKRPGGFYTVITLDEDGPLLDDGGEWLVQMDSSLSELVKAYRARRQAEAVG
jgi:hypothetical protein